MVTTFVDTFLIFMAAYVTLGALFAVYFITKGAQQLDKGVEGSPWHFRLIIFPGSMLLWIVLLIKLLRK